MPSVDLVHLTALYYPPSLLLAIRAIIFGKPIVWSWGVIHHSANIPTILSEISRVIRPFGQ